MWAQKLTCWSVLSWFWHYIAAIPLRTMSYCLESYFGGVLMFILSMTSPGVTKFCTLKFSACTINCTKLLLGHKFENITFHPGALSSFSWKCPPIKTTCYMAVRLACISKPVKSYAWWSCELGSIQLYSILHTINGCEWAWQISAMCMACDGSCGSSSSIEYS